jgi:hypothetical protein
MQTWVRVNLASALLFKGETTEAMKLFREFRSAELRKSVLNDFADYKKAGVIPPEQKKNVEKIKKMLAGEM